MNAPQYTQDNLRMTITSPFGPDKLLFKSFQGEEALSQPFRFTVEMLSQADDLDFKKIVGNSLGITLQYWTVTAIVSVSSVAINLPSPNIRVRI